MQLSERENSALSRFKEYRLFFRLKKVLYFWTFELWQLKWIMSGFCMLLIGSDENEGQTCRMVLNASK